MRRSAKLAGTLALCALPLGCSGSDGAARNPARNVVFLMLDTVRADRLTPYGYERDTTPHLKGLADAGVLFERAQAAAPWTVPSIASIFTGLAPSVHRAGIEGEGPRRFHPEDAFYGFDERLPTLVGELRGRGLRTAGFFSNPLVAIDCFARDFETKEVKRAKADEVVDWGIERLGELADERFFLYLHFMDAHVPLEPPLELVRRFGPELPAEELARWARKAGRWDRFKKVQDVDQPALRGFIAAKRTVYDAALAFLDAEIGRLLEALERLELAEDTLVVVTADHGEEFWEHWELQMECYDPDARSHVGCAHGHTLFQELLHVPLIVRGPGAAPGHRVETRVPLADVGPTLLERVAPHRSPELGEATSLTRALGGAEPEARSVLSESIAHGYELKALVTPNGDKLIEAQHAGERDLFFSLARDPGETVDLTGSEAERTRAVKRELDERLERLLRSRRERGAPAADVPFETLKDLGYAGDGD